MQDEHDDNVVLGRPKQQGSYSPLQAHPLNTSRATLNAPRGHTAWPYTNDDVQASRAELASPMEAVNTLIQPGHVPSSTTDAELRRAHVALMEKEVIQPKDGDLFRLVKHYYRKLQDWHDEHTGWHIRRSATVIRLLRNPSTVASGYVTEELKEPRD